MHLDSLMLLNASHNKINQIGLNAFEGLTNLKSLDLSFNSVQYILQNWFFHMPNLEELYLRGNNFRTINTPIIESSSLKVCNHSF